jgi:SAM-dependent methyltransferase
MRMPERLFLTMPKTVPFETYVNRYEAWFEKYPYVYAAELKAVRELVPEGGFGVEVGVGTGRFAGPLGTQLGVEPSVQMGKIARLNGIHVAGGVAEALPLGCDRFDYVLMVTTVCFLDDIDQAFRECYRVLNRNGCLIVGFVDRTSPLGQIYLTHQNENVFYRDASFYSVEEIIAAMKQTGFRDFSFQQTIFGNLSQVTPDESVKAGHGEGSFVVVQGRK